MSVAIIARQALAARSAGVNKVRSWKRLPRGVIRVQGLQRTPRQRTDTDRMETCERSEQETPSVARVNRKDAARGSGANAGGVSRRDAARTAPDPEGFLITGACACGRVPVRVGCCNLLFYRSLT